MEIKNYTLRIEEDLLRKFRYVAKYDDRSVNAQILNYIKRSIAEFEKEHGKIELEDTEKN